MCDHAGEDNEAWGKVSLEKGFSRNLDYKHLSRLSYSHLHSILCDNVHGVRYLVVSGYFQGRILMRLKGRTVRIIVSEPWDWEENLFGTILSDRGGEKLLVELTKPIKGKKLTSNLMELKPRSVKETFKPLSQNYSVTVGGALVTENSDEFDYIIIGSVTID